jgi:hypothetical protein
MTELSRTRTFSVTMYYHSRFMAISIALFGLSIDVADVPVSVLPFSRRRDLIAIARLAGPVNAVYAVDLLGAGAGCLLLMPALNQLGAPCRNTRRCWTRPETG